MRRLKKKTRRRGENQHQDEGRARQILTALLSAQIETAENTTDKGKEEKDQTREKKSRAEKN